MDISTLNECMYSSAPSKNCSESQGKNNPHCQNNTLGHIQLQQQTKVAGGRGGHFHDPYLAPPSAAGLLGPPDISVWARAINKSGSLSDLWWNDSSNFVLFGCFSFVRRGGPQCPKHNEADNTLDTDCMRVAVCIGTQ